MKGSCPTHGTKYLEETEEGRLICMAPIPRDKFGLKICYYVVPKKPGPKPAEICSECGRKAEYGTLCLNCRNEKRREAYQKNKGKPTKSKKIPFAKR